LTKFNIWFYILALTASVRYKLIGLIFPEKTDFNLRQLFFDFNLGIA